MEKPRFIVSLITADNDYQLEQASAAQEAGRRLGVDVQIIYAENDPIQQSQQLLKIIQSSSEQPPKALVVEPAGTAMPRVAEAAASSGIAWVMLNQEPDYIPELRKSYQVPIFSVSADNREIGRLQGRQFAALMPGGGTVLYIQGPSGSSAALQRTVGVQEAKPANVQLKMLKSATWTESGGYQAVSHWLRLTTSRAEHIGVVAGQNDSLAYGARKAFREQEEVADDARETLRFTGVDGLAKTGKEWVSRGLFSATVIVPPITPSAIELALQASRTKTQPPACTLIPPESFPPLQILSGKV
jgi:ribose transport system substrate-binding protein